MWEVELRPEIKKELRDPEKYVKGMNMTYNGMTITMVGVLMMMILYFMRPEHVLHPLWIEILGLLVAGWGEFLKFRAK
ncbi:MAG: hypothetical protein HN646_11270 [Nitrospina sp.]|jgi:hypothetical protein|nr:hypothetical protein [Nitrospina sp.]MDG1844321.1 hypothetical protein [Nitrospinaceae bacterium]MBT5258906.1 hypothetical protein [Nitrospina sp.]MBT5968222.1 hypothetical protein [Nitrospina sp.]MBT6297210.1 hypothetical protein [Nitrospina sp.]|tara:strand:- start:1979 stop:2212 length:234 start_codon:yes stop_codon:yes gene_type:complete